MLISCICFCRFWICTLDFVILSGPIWRLLSISMMYVYLCLIFLTLLWKDSHKLWQSKERLIIHTWTGDKWTGCSGKEKLKSEVLYPTINLWDYYFLEPAKSLPYTLEDIVHFANYLISALFSAQFRQRYLATCMMGILKIGHCRHYNLIKCNYIFKVPNICSLEWLFHASKCPWARLWTLNPCWSRCCLNVWMHTCLVEQFEFEWSKLRRHLEGDISKVLSSTSTQLNNEAAAEDSDYADFYKPKRKYNRSFRHTGDILHTINLFTTESTRATTEKQGVDCKTTFLGVPILSWTN